MTDTPQLIAHFAVNEEGEPQYVETRTGLKHYRIVIEIENAPSDLVAATFELDPSYYLPVRTVERGEDGKVSLETTAYGDYALRADLRSKSGVIPVKTTLRKALLSGKSPDQKPEIDAAIAEIAAH